MWRVYLESSVIAGQVDARLVILADKYRALHELARDAFNDV